MINANVQVQTGKKVLNDSQKIGFKVLPFVEKTKEFKMMSDRFFDIEEDSVSQFIFYAMILSTVGAGALCVSVMVNIFQMFV